MKHFCNWFKIEALTREQLWRSKSTSSSEQIFFVQFNYFLPNWIDAKCLHIVVRHISGKNLICQNCLNRKLINFQLEIYCCWFTLAWKVSAFINIFMRRRMKSSANHSVLSRRKQIIESIHTQTETQMDCIKVNSIIGSSPFYRVKSIFCAFTAAILCSFFCRSDNSQQWWMR